MASSQNSPVLIQHASPPHTLSPSMTVVSISAFPPEPLNEPSPLPEPIVAPASPVLELEPEPEANTIISTEDPDTEMADAPAVQSDQTAGNPTEQPEPSTTTGEEVSLPQEGLPSPPELLVVPTEVATTPPGEPPSQEESIPPPPPPAAEEPRPEVPEWATWEDDLSTPNEEEMREINARDSELSALDVPSVEKRIYQDVDDPEQRPVKKLRLSWVIKNVRGNRDKPNQARVMVSPPAKVDGNYWQIKFYPRGNKCASLSAYIRCSRYPPKTESDVADSTFSFYEGSPEADLGTGAVPTQVLKTEPKSKEDGNGSSTEANSSLDSRKQDDPSETNEQTTESAQADNTSPKDISKEEKSGEEEWRVPAQLGMIIYNPEEPRTCTYMSSEHQFSRSNDDWGWTNFVGPWRDIHLRQHAQRAPLLRNDTIAIDAYIRIFDDPSQALWWHTSESEPHWDSKSLAGYYPMGTPPLYHSPAVAGMTAWLLLAPFRKVIQTVDAGEWRRNSQIRPRPVTCQLQMVLFLMSFLRKEKETYVDVYPVIQALKEHGESFSDVVTFWQALRGGLEFELEDDQESLQKLGKIFDSISGPTTLPPLPVEDVSDIQQGLEKVLEAQNFKGDLPDFLPLALARQKFDKKTREWKLLHDRVILNEELDVSKFTTTRESAKYTLYGFMVHVGERNSGKIYSVLRPNGPGTKWLAFEDGDGNKVFSYTRKRIQEYEGLEGQALKDFNSTRQTAYLAMYIKTDRLAEYLPGHLEPFKLQKWLVPYLQWNYQEKLALLDEEKPEEESDEINVELYSEEGVFGREGLLDMFNIKKQSEHKGLFHLMTMSKEAKFQDLRRDLAQKLGIDDPKNIRLFIMSYTGMGNYTSAQMHPVDLSHSLALARPVSQPLCLWYAILKTAEELELFGHDDQPTPSEPAQKEDDVGEEEGRAAELDSEAVAGDLGEAQVSVVDAEQDSVLEAVAAAIEETTNVNVHQTTLAVQEAGDPDTPMQLESAPPVVEDSVLADVPHGHLIDAAVHETRNTGGESTGNVDALDTSPVSAALDQAEADVVAAVVTENADQMDFTMQPVAEIQSSESESTDSSESASLATSVPERPVKHVYGFIQLLDFDKQNFTVHGTFFAKWEDKVKDFIRQRMGYSADKDFNVWRRESVVEGSLIEADDTFEDNRITNGVDLIVGEVVSDADVKSLEKQGKLSDPFALSKYLRMVERKHPVESKTTTEAIELATFGADYYKGPLVKGRPHGDHCLCITSAGHTYEGPLVFNKKCGKGGKMTYQNGDTYDGEWDEDERHGQGTFVESRTGNRYVGGFEYGKRWGMGTTYWQVADEQADLCQICYSQEIDALFFDCGHVCSCVECARQCEICPICRRSVKQVVKMFRA